MSSEAWKKWVTEQRQEYLARKKSAHLIREKGSLSWATPNTMDYLEQRSYEAMKKMIVSGGRKNRSMPPNLREQVNPEMVGAVDEARAERNKCTVEELDPPARKPTMWPTASTRDYKGGYTGGRIRKGKISMDTLDVAVQAYTEGGLVDQQKESWPTPTVQEAGKIGNVANYGQKGLSNHPAIRGLPDREKTNKSGKPQESQKKWPTPRANKVHPVITEENRSHLANRKKANLEEDVAGHCGKATGKLNPDWVEQLMGLPVGWTDFGCLGTESSLR
jgi:hypothetical protein